MIYCKNSCPRISTTNGIEVVNQQGVSNGAESHDNLRNLSYHANAWGYRFQLSYYETIAVFAIRSSP